MHSSTERLVRMINRVAQRLEMCSRDSAVSPSVHVTPPSPQGLSRSEVDALIAEQLEKFKTTLERQGRLR